MIKIIIILLITIWLSKTQAAYISRMTAMNRLRAPVAFRPGVILARPYPQRIMQTATRRTPYIVYRNTPHRYAMKHLTSTPLRNVFGPWKTTRIPLGSSTPTVFVRSASPSPVIHADGTGAIHTIPAPNLSLLEKPIVVIDSSESINIQEPHKTTYEVTEKYSEPPYQSNPKIESPIGFSKASPSGTDLQNIVRQNTALHVASEYPLSIHLSQPAVQLQQPSIIPQQFTLQGFHAIPNPQDLIHRGPEQIIIPQNTFYTPDSIFMQKIQTHLVHQFPDAEFIPYIPEVQPQYQNTQSSETQNQMFLLQNEQITKQTPSAFISGDGKRNVVQRETQESSFASIVPKAFSTKNVSENLIETEITSTTENVTSHMPTEIQTPTTTIKSVVETNTEVRRTTPIFYAQIGQSVGNVIAKGFYSASNDVRAAAEANIVKQEKKSGIRNESNSTTTTNTTTYTTTSISPTTIVTTTTTTTTPAAPATSTTFVVVDKTLKKKEDNKETKKGNLPKLSLGSPFEKPTESPSVNIAYTLLRANDKQPRINEDGEVFAGQLVEAKISEDQEFIKEKANFINKPLRLLTVTEKRLSESTSKRSAVKAKIPPKSKLTFDDKTGEPVLRVYASYIDSPGQKEVITTKLSNMKRNKDKEVSKKQDFNIDWKEDDIKNVEKSFIDVDREEQFGLKIRSDDY